MKQNIVWLASYPKSGNTMVRAFLSAYLFTDNGKLNSFFPLRKISGFNLFKNYNHLKNFPNLKFFKQNPEEISKYWIDNQKAINNRLGTDIKIYKTHNALVKHNSNYFTNTDQTKCFIYIVRDPRSVVISSKEHYGFKNYKEAVNIFLCKYSK